MLYMHTTYICDVTGLLCFFIMARYLGTLSGDGDECRMVARGLGVGVEGKKQSSNQWDQTQFSIGAYIDRHIASQALNYSSPKRLFAPIKNITLISKLYLDTPKSLLPLPTKRGNWIRRIIVVLD